MIYNLADTIDDRLCADLLPEPAKNANKYSRGCLLVIAGSTHYPGAAILTTLAACRSGAGYVTLAVPEPVVPIAQSHLLTAPVVGFRSDSGGGFARTAYEHLTQMIDACDAIVMGPGMGRDSQAASLVRKVVTTCPVPLVLDADGLNAFEGHVDDLCMAKTRMILTPHAGELARLGTVDTLAAPSRVVVAKGPDTVISDGVREVVDQTGPPSLATAGTGDVLAGLIGGFVCQGLGIFDAAALGVKLHSTAARLAVKQTTSCGMIATDVINFIPRAMKSIKESSENAYGTTVPAIMG